MDSIAEKAAVAKGTLYLYFKDKEALFYYLLDEFIGEFDELIKKIESRNLSIVDEIAEVVYSLLLYRKNQKFLYRVFKEARELKTYISVNGVKMIENHIMDYLKRRLSSAFEGKKLNTEMISFVIIKIYSALAFEWEEAHDPLDEQEISHAVSTIFRGLSSASNNPSPAGFM